MVSAYPPKKNVSNSRIASIESYRTLYKQSIENPEKFWGEIAERLDWYTKWNSVRDVDFRSGNIKWFSGGILNASYNCIDRHVENGFGDNTAIIWEGNDPNQSKKYSYNELLKEVSQLSNALKELGVGKGDRVCIYLQMIPELAISALACARIGAVHSIVFGAFSSDSLRERINDSECKILITQDTGVRGLKKNIPFGRYYCVVYQSKLPFLPFSHTLMLVLQHTFLLSHQHQLLNRG